MRRSPWESYPSARSTPSIRSAAAERARCTTWPSESIARARSTRFTTPSAGSPARILHAPRYWPEYCVDYYAFFFKDSEGIEYEVASFARDVYFPV